MLPELNDEIVKLHDLARRIEQEFGVGELSKDIRRAADRLNALVKAVQ